MRALLLVLIATLPLTASATDVTGVVQVEGKTVSLRVGAATTALDGDLAQELALLDGETVKLEVDRDKAKLTVRSVRSPERIEVAASAKLIQGRWMLVTPKGERYVPAGRTKLISQTKQRTYDVWRFPKDAKGEQRVVVVAYEAETTKSWLILLDKPELSIPRGLIRGRGRSVWVEQEQPGWVWIRFGDKSGWVQSQLTAPVELEPKAGIIKKLDAAGE